MTFSQDRIEQALSQRCGACQACPGEECTEDGKPLLEASDGRHVVHGRRLFL